MLESRARILVIGLGQIGYSNAEYMTGLGLHADGYDIDEKAVQRVLDHEIIHGEASNFKGYDYYVICVSTHRPEDISIPCLDGLFDVAEKLSYEGKTGALVSIESTVTKGASHNIKEILRHRLHVAHCPHRFYSHEKEEHGVRQTRVLGGCEVCCTSKAISFYRDLLNIPLHIVDSVEIAELSKVIENSYRFLQIAFAEELKMFCYAYDVDFEQLRSAINSKWNTKILEAREGIGGHCLPKDTSMYLKLLEQVLEPNIVAAAKRTDHLYRLLRAREKASDIAVIA